MGVPDWVRYEFRRRSLPLKVVVVVVADGDGNIWLTWVFLGCVVGAETASHFGF